jgi:hypothetical protein
MTTDTPLTRYRAIKRAPASGSSLPSYTTWWDTTKNRVEQGDERNTADGLAKLPSKSKAAQRKKASWDKKSASTPFRSGGRVLIVRRCLTGGVRPGNPPPPYPERRVSLVSGFLDPLRRGPGKDLYKRFSVMFPRNEKPNQLFCTFPPSGVGFLAQWGGDVEYGFQQISITIADIEVLKSAFQRQVSPIVWPEVHPISLAEDYNFLFSQSGRDIDKIIQARRTWSIVRLRQSSASSSSGCARSRISRRASSNVSHHSIWNFWFCRQGRLLGQKQGKAANAPIYYSKKLYV